MKSDNKLKVLNLVLIVLFLASAGMVVLYMRNTEEINNDLMSEKLRSEMLLSEKLSLDKQIKNFKEVIETLKGKDRELDKLLTEANAKIEKQQDVIRRLNNDNASLEEYTKQLNELKKTKEDLITQLAAMTYNNKSLNDQLAAKEQMLAESRAANTGLSDEEQKKFFVDNLRIESLNNKKTRLTVRAHKTKNIVISFDIPWYLSDKVTAKSFFLELKKQNGVSVKGEQLATLHNISENVLVATTGKAYNEVPKRIEISFQPKEKLKEGIYIISIYSKDEHLGNAQIRLKK